MCFLRRLAHTSQLSNRASFAALVMLFACAGVGLLAQAPGDASALPKRTTALEGLPQIRIETTRDEVTRRELAPAEADNNRLLIRVSDGQFFWSSRDDRPLVRTTAGDFTYLSSTDPGRYVRIRRLNDRLTYVEHVDTDFGSVTYWGELRVVVGR